MIQFATESPWLFFFLMVFAMWWACFAWVRLLRAINISKHGWPPPHCDADGDFLDTDTD
jgi:hypothetical protein